jgi:hypothetical protein
VNAGYRSEFVVYDKWECSFWQYITDNCHYNTDRLIKFGFHPTGRAHFGGRIWKD